MFVKFLPLKKMHRLHLFFKLFVTCMVVYVGVVAGVRAQEVTTLKVVSMRPLNDTLTEPEFRSYKMVSDLIADFNYKQKKIFIEFEVFEKKAAFEKAAQDAIAILGCFDDNFCEQDMQVASRLQRPLIGALSGAEDFRPDTNRWSFPVRASEAEEVNALFQIAKKLAIKTVVLGVENNAYGKRLSKLVATMKKPPEVKILAQFTLDAKANQKQLVQSVATKKPLGIIFLSDKDENVSAFVKAWKASRVVFSPSLMHTSALANQDYGKHLLGYFGGSIFVTTVPSPWSGATTLQRKHQKAAQNAGLYGLSYRSLEMYIATSLLLQAVEAGGHTPEQLRSILRQNDMFNIGGFKLSYQKGKDVTTFTEQAVLGRSGEFRH